jgi:hypothetical protein
MLFCLVQHQLMMFLAFRLALQHHKTNHIRWVAAEGMVIDECEDAA